MICPYCNCESCTCGSESDYFDPIEIDEYMASVELEMIQEASDGE